MFIEMPNGNGLILGAAGLVCSVFFLVVVLGNEKQERTLAKILDQLEAQACQPDDATDRATPDR
ncbi:MAG: uncharacterized membrane protein YciS (DUF1049 family) [Gammaproteobacteria bacterium]|jgi:uncharacterized membrane protein YciS (DUF1049 family)